MIFYNGVCLESVANVKIEDIRISPIQYNAVTRPRPVRGGSAFIRNRPGTRTVAITFALLNDDEVSRQKSIDNIDLWAKTDHEYRLELPGHPDVYLMGVCTAKPEPSLRQWWESKLRLVFTCFENPYWNSKVEKSASCGSDFFVKGNAEPLMRIERTLSGAASNQAYAFDGNTMTFTTIPAGNMVIDLNNQTAAVGNTDIMQYYNVNSRFVIPKTGAMKITGTGTIKYRERWE